MNQSWLISCPLFTCWLSCDQELVIQDSAPFIRKFRGQPLSNVQNWAKRFGLTSIYIYTDGEYIKV